jgi:hypothetical protein
MTTDIPTMINRLNRYPEVVARQMHDAMEHSLNLIEADARTFAPRDVGRLGGSINHRIDGSGLSIEGHVGPSVRYGAPVEFGRRAGARMPPVDALMPWVQRHWRLPLVNRQAVLPGFYSQVTATNRRSAPRNVTQAMLRRRAFALAVSISRKGIVRQPYLHQAYGKNSQRILLLFRQIGTRVSASLAGEPLV